MVEEIYPLVHQVTTLGANQHGIGVWEHYVAGKLEALIETD